MKRLSQLRRQRTSRRWKMKVVQKSPTIIEETSKHQLMGASYSMLGSISRKGFFSDVVCGDRRNGFVVKTEPEREYWCATCRNRKPSNGCPLCNIGNGEFPFSEYGIVKWKKDLIIIANAYPYLPNHLLITTSTHITQDYMFESGVFGRICEFFEAFMFSGTMFFNHFAGNSLTHFHVHHTTRCDFAILRKLRERVDLTPTKYDNVKIVDDGGCFRAILLLGTDSWVYGENILANISRQSLLVNIVWVNPIEYGPSCIIIPRTSTRSNYGSTELAGFILDCDARVELEEVCKNTILDIGNMQQLV